MRTDIISENDCNRFWSKVNKTDPTSCWLWTASKTKGYGQFVICKKRWIAHRLAWVIANKELIPKGMCICHRCDNPSCCNPNHLFIGTPADNIADMVSKNRVNRLHLKLKGENHGRHKLTESQVATIRELARTTNMFQKDIGKMFGVRQGHITKIVNGQLWARSFQKESELRLTSPLSNDSIFGKNKLETSE